MICVKWVGTGWGSPGKKGRGGGGVGEERAGSKSPEMAGEIEKILQHFVIFFNRNGTTRREPLQKGAENRSKRHGKREYK